MFKKLILFTILLALFFPAIGQDNEYRFLLSNTLRAKASGGSSLPADAAGYLLNNGTGTLSWGAISFVGYLRADGTVPLTAPWNSVFAIKSPSIVRSTTLTIASSTSMTQNADYYCDGTADEVQINAAIQALDGLGGRIVLMEGTFYINAPIAYSTTGTADNNIILEGQGNATILTIPTGHASSIFMINAIGVNNLEFKNFKIDGNGTNITGTTYHGIVIDGIAKAKIVNVTITNGCISGTSYGFNLVGGSSDISVLNCYVGSWGSNGIEIGLIDHLLISNCIFNTSRVEMYSNGNRISFTNNIFYESAMVAGTATGGLYIDGLVIIGNIFHNPTINISAQVSINNANHITISGNYFNCKYAPVAIKSGITDVTFTNNIIVSPAIMINLDGANGLISGNKFMATDNYGAGILNGSGSAATNWTIKNNSFSKTASQYSNIGIQLAKGTNILIKDNDFLNIDHGIQIGAAATSIKSLDNNFVGVTNEYVNAAILSVNFEYGKVNRRLYIVKKTFTQFAALGADSLTADMVIAVLPAKTKIVGMYCDTTTKFIGGGTTAAVMAIGKSAGGVEYIASHDVFTAAIVKGQADADMGTELTRAAAIQGGALVNWTTAITVTARLTTTTAYTDDLTQGSATFYIETECY